MENSFFPSSDIKIFQLLSALVTSLDGKNLFSMQRAHWAKTRNSQPCYFSNVGVYIDDITKTHIFQARFEIAVITPSVSTGT